MRIRYSFSSRKTGRARDPKNFKKQKGKYPLMIEKIISESDIILEILDARFPEETRNHEIEKKIIKSKKKIIYILNKADLTTKKIIKEANLLYPMVFVSCKERKGIKKLRDLIKQVSTKIKKSDGKKINIGIIGYPNTGKSSLINILIGRASAGTGSDAGFTKGVQKLKLDSNILLFDSPGVIPQKEYSHTEQEKISRHTKVGARSFSQVKEPELVVASLMKEYPTILEKFYKIEANNDVEILIEELGRKKGFLKKGGIVNEDQISRLILKDWQTGKIKF